MINSFQLKPHPEGGYFKETYRSEESYEVSQGIRSACTAILFLLQEGECSHFHRLRSDELWYFHTGGPLELFEITVLGKLKRTVLGLNFSLGERLQYCVPKDHWFASRPLEGEKYSLVSCTVSPGFEFCDFELATKRELLKLYPQYQGVIEKLSLS